MYLIKVNKKTLQKEVNYIQSQQSRQQNDIKNVILVSLLLTLNTVWHCIAFILFNFENISHLFLSKASLIVQTKLNYEILNIKFG